MFLPDVTTATTCSSVLGAVPVGTGQKINQGKDILFHS